MLGVNATEQEILIDMVVDGPLKTEYEIAVAAIYEWRAAPTFRASGEHELTRWLKANAHLPFGKVEVGRNRRQQKLDREHQGRLRGPSLAIMAYNAARCRLLEKRFWEAGVGWCTEHRGVVAAECLQLVYHECLLWYRKSNDSYSQYASHDGLQRYVFQMCDDCRSRFGFGERAGHVHGSAVVSSSYLFSARREGSRLIINYPIGWKIPETGAGETGFISATGPEDMPPDVSERVFALADDWYGKVADEWRISQQLEWHINPHYPTKPFFGIKLQRGIHEDGRRIDFISLMPV